MQNAIEIKHLTREEKLRMVDGFVIRGRTTRIADLA